jgi:hypothetical protein
MGQGGNASEWEETAYFDLVNDNPDDVRGTRGGAWASAARELVGFGRGGATPTAEIYAKGFRVASLIPEPNGLLLAACSALALLYARRRKN